MVTFEVGAGEVGVVEEVGEEFWEGFFGLHTMAFFGGAGFGPVKERVPGADGDNFEGGDIAFREELLRCWPAGDILFVS